jgi:hypothetical protein
MVVSDKLHWLRGLAGVLVPGQRQGECLNGDGACSEKAGAGMKAIALKAGGG